MINGISIVSVWVLDQDSAKEFYADKLGFTVTNDIQMEGGMRWLTVRPPGSDGQELLLMDPARSMLDAETAQKLGLVTFALDDIDWDDEVRVFLEERASFSPDGLTGLEANLRFAGPETMESKIFARLTAWQNWIFQRPNAIGEEGALKRYGTGQKPVFDTRRV